MTTSQPSRTDARTSVETVFRLESPRIIAGVTRPDQLRANVDASKREPIEPSLIEELNGWYQDKVRPEIRGRI